MAADGSVVFSIGATDEEARKKLQALEKEIDNVAKSMNKNIDKRGGIEKSLADASEQAEATAARIREIKAEMADYNEIIRGKGRGNISVEQFNERKARQAELIQELSEQEKIYARQVADVQKLEKAEAGIQNTIQEQSRTMYSLQEQAGGYHRQLSLTSSNSEKLREKIDEVSSSFKKGFRNILKWGFGIRSLFILVRRLRSYIKEAVRAFSESDPETKKNMDSLKQSLATLKVSWGAAFAPILNAVAPLLQKLIGWLTTAANAVQQFVAVLSGARSYKKAIANNNALTDSLNSAGGAAKEAKKELLGFDEINRLNDNNSGGGGGGAAGASVSEEEISPWMLNFYEKISPIIERVKGMFLGLRDVVVGILTGDFEKAFDGAGRIIKNFGATVNLTLGLLNPFINTFFDGLTEWIKKVADNLDEKFGKNGTFSKLAYYIIYGINLVRFTITTAISTVGATFEGLCSFISNLVAGDWEAAWADAANLVLMSSVDMKDAIVQMAEDTTNELFGFGASVRKEMTGVNESLESVKGPAAHSSTSLSSSFANTANASADLAEALSNNMQAIRDQIAATGQSSLSANVSGNGISFGATVTNVFSFIKRMFAAPFRLAKGGIVSGATPFIAGEAGKEAIVPLERNTQWIDTVAKGIIDGLTGNDKFADYITGRVVPAIVRGAVVPPRALSGGGSMFTDGDIERLVNGLTAALTANEGEERVPVIIDGRTVAEIVTRHQRQMERGYA